MGLKSSPHGCVKMQALAEEFLRGHPSALSNPLRYDQVILNLPGQPDYNPSFPWVYKFDEHAQAIASNMATYIDDI